MVVGLLTCISVELLPQRILAGSSIMSEQKRTARKATSPLQEFITDFSWTHRFRQGQWAHPPCFSRESFTAKQFPSGRSFATKIRPTSWRINKLSLVALGTSFVGVVLTRLFLHWLTGEFSQIKTPFPWGAAVIGGVLLVAVELIVRFKNEGFLGTWLAIWSISASLLTTATALSLSRAESLRSETLVNSVAPWQAALALGAYIYVFLKQRQLRVRRQAPGSST